MKKIISIIIIIVLCGGKVNSQTVGINLSLSGPETGNNLYEAVNRIQSTQVINSGKTTYRAGNEIVLNPGFETQPGSEFEAVIDDFSNRLTIMTYNLGKVINLLDLNKQAKVIKSSGADVVAIQEVKGKRLTYNRLKKKTGFKGRMCTTMKYMRIRYGIALLWDEAKLGAPIAEVTRHKIKTPKGKDKRRAYIIAEFNDFYIIATHLCTNADENQKMVNEILNENIIKNYQKPVYIAGDLNPNSASAIDMPVAAGFEVLNNTDKNDPEYYTKHATRKSGGQPDLILGYNQNPNWEIIWRGVPDGATFTISDHLPYVVKVKLK